MKNIKLLVFWVSLAALVYFLVAAGLTVGQWGGILSFGGLIFSIFLELWGRK